MRIQGLPRRPETGLVSRSIATIAEPVQLHAHALEVEYGGRVLRMAPQQAGSGETKALPGCGEGMQVIGMGSAEADDAAGAGLVLAESGAHPVYGALAVPDDHGVAQNVERILLEAGHVPSGYELLEASRGGFAKVDPPLLAFIEATEGQSGIALEPLYTGKALLALRDAVQAQSFARGTRLVFVHTGGLQGRRGMGGAA